MKVSTKALFLLPLLLFFGLSLFLFKGLFSDPRQHESALLNRPLPAFELPDLMAADKRYRRDDLLGEPFLLNVWGVWCPTCNAELAYLTQLRQQGVKIVGLYYEQGYDPDFDGPFDLAALQRDVRLKLRQHGNPYQLNLLDLDRSVAFDLGVTGAPETFVVDAKGVIRLHHVGDINPTVWEKKIAPVWQQLSGEMQP